MVQLLRYIALLCQRPWLKRYQPLDASVHEFRVYPFDCDLNFHLTNGRYPVWLDLVRSRWFLEIGAAPLFLRQGWRSVLASQTITFIREIPPWAKVRVTTDVLHWDRKYLYLEHRFYVGQKLHASAIARVAMIKARRVASVDAMLRAIHGPQYQCDAPELPSRVEAKIALLNAKKEAA